MRTLVALLAVLCLSAPVLAEQRLTLTVDKAALGELSLAWEDGCARSGTDYAVYEGTLGSFTSHSWLECGTSGALSATVGPMASSAYYLVVPQEGGKEGSYGLDSGGVERDVGLATCVPEQELLECVETTFLNADPAQVARLDTLLAAAGTILIGGGSYTDVANMLAAESDVTDISSNGVSLYFTVDGLPSSIYDTNAARHDGPLNDVIPPSGGSGSSRALAQGLQPWFAVEPLLPRGQRMVGEDDDGDGRRDLPKFARVLSPWAFDFTGEDSAPLVRNILNGVRDYQEGDVHYDDNTTDLIANSMTLADYMSGWDDLDVIFISSHGDSDPGSGWGPEPYLFLGIGGATCASTRDKLLAENPAAGSIPGLHCLYWIDISPGESPKVGVDTVGSPAFWQHAHGGALSKKLIYFDACRTAARPALAESLAGPDSIFLGWSEFVDPAISVASAQAFFDESVGKGFPVLRSFLRACEGDVCFDSDDGADLLAGWERADLRIREALEILSVPELGFCGLSSTLPIELTCPSCGAPPGMGLSTSFSFVIEGVRPEEIAFITDPFDFAKYQLRLFADVDDVESGYAQPLTDLNTVDLGDGAYADLLPITLAIDDACPYDIFEYRPWVLLPAFDEAAPGNDGRDRTYAWDGLFTLDVDPVLLP